MRRETAAVSGSCSGREPQAQSGQFTRGAAILLQPSGADHQPRCPQARPVTSGRFPDILKTRTPPCATRMSSRPLGLNLLQHEPDHGSLLRRMFRGGGRWGPSWVCLAGVHLPCILGACRLAGPRPPCGLCVHLWSRQRPVAGRWGCSEVQG